MSVPVFQRRRRGNPEPEDASDAGCLLISEVNLFFSRPGEGSAERDASATAYVTTLTSVAQKTKEYVEGFSRYKEQTTIREVRALLIKHAAQTELDADDKGLQLSQFEMAQLANLAISDVDEAHDAQLESLLNELAAIRKFA